MLKTVYNKILFEFDLLICELTENNIYTNKLGLGRSILALSLLLTLLFNDSSIIFPDLKIFHENENLGFFSLNFFLIFGDNIELSKFFAILLLTFIISGYYPQITCIILAWICLSFSNLCIAAEGGDQIISTISILLIPICLLDNRKNHWFRSTSFPSEYPKLISNFFLNLIRIQISLVYFISATSKFEIKEWHDGTAIYYWLNDPIFGLSNFIKHLGIQKLLTHGFWVGLMTWGALITEIILFMGLLIRKKYRKYILLLGILFHFTIFIFMGLFSFFITMTGALIFYLGDLNKNLNFFTNEFKNKTTSE